jgi:hypothetical protein
LRSLSAVTPEILLLTGLAAEELCGEIADRAIGTRERAKITDKIFEFIFIFFIVLNSLLAACTFFAIS